jgi:hypothetical protein
VRGLAQEVALAPCVVHRAALNRAVARYVESLDLLDAAAADPVGLGPCGLFVGVFVGAVRTGLMPAGPALGDWGISAGGSLGNKRAVSRGSTVVLNVGIRGMKKSERVTAAAESTAASLRAAPL